MILCMNTNEIEQAWEECTVEHIKAVDAFSIDPAVFEPQLEDDFIFEDRSEDKEVRQLWNSCQNMDGVMFMTEPLDGYYRDTVYSEPDYCSVSLRTYKNRIKIAPADSDCTYEAFEHFITEFEKHVCELQFLGGLEEMK